MKDKPLHIVVLAAGQGTRMKSALPKVLHPVGGKPMLAHVLDTARQLKAAVCHVVIGHGADKVHEAITPPDGLPLQYVTQTEQLGTGHAVQQALPGIPEESLVLVMYGDVPLVTAETLQRLLAAGAEVGALLSVHLDDPIGYGRLIIASNGRLSAIVEEKDATDAQRRLQDVNTGFLCAPADRLRNWLDQVGNDNAAGEYYLTDIVRLAAGSDAAMEVVSAAEAAEVEGVNNRVQLAHVERMLQRRQAEALMRAGVHIIDPQRLDIRGEVQVGSDVMLDVGVVLEGRVSLGNGVRVGPYSVLRDCSIGDGTSIASHCVLEQAQIGSGCSIGPYARLRPGAECADDSHVGNFVEMKNTRLGRGSKANHLSYLGDSDIGAGVNVGAGTITCNYDGANKHRTEIGDGAFIGSNSSLVAPVRIGANATIGAGSVITRNAPDEALTLARTREQKSYKSWQRPTKQGPKGSA